MLQNNTVAVIGGGVSGLTAGIYAMQVGFQAEIYEMNPMLGGECTSWNRQGYHIDNCIHFLVGCNEGEALNRLWKNVGVLSDEVMLYREPYFYCMEMNGVALHLWRDIEKTRAELLSVAPEDEREINLFLECVKGCECIKPPCEKSPAHMNPFQFMKMVMQMKDAGKANSEYGKQTMEEFSNRFKSPYLRALFGKYFNGNFIALTFVTSYAFYTSDTVAIPEGGSVGMIGRMKHRFESLGGKIHTRSEVTSVSVKNGQIDYMTLKNGDEIRTGSFIWAADPYQLFYSMIGENYLDQNLKAMYDHPEGYSANTGYQAAFGIVSDEDISLPEGSVIFPCDAYVAAGEKHDFCGIRVYNYDDKLFPRGKRVIQCNLLQTAQNYDYWLKLREDKAAYENEKRRIARELKKRVEKQYPALSGKLVLLGTYSPVTFGRWCNAYKGGYMSFNALKGFKSRYVKSTVKGISNLYLASQWTQNGGGLPIAAASGKFAAEILSKNQRKQEKKHGSNMDQNVRGG